MNRVVIRIDEAGALTYYAEGDVRLFLVDERAPNDRVYESVERTTTEEIDDIIGDDKIGTRFDGSEAARRLGQVEDGEFITLDQLKAELETKH